jgi:hypothetical protein
VKKENRPVFTKITRVPFPSPPFPSQKLLWDLLQASMQWAPPGAEHTAAAQPNRLPLCHHPRAGLVLSCATIKNGAGSLLSRAAITLERTGQLSPT